MECPVCYESSANLKLGCGHTMCFKCTREWLVKCKTDEKPGCPMCRKPIRFKGLDKIEKALEAERYESQYNDAYSELLESCFEVYQSAVEAAPSLGYVWRHGLQEDILELEKTFGVLKNFYYLDPSDIVEEIYEGVVLSPKKEIRRWNREEWAQRDKFAVKQQRLRVMNRHR
jgi:hypothetical protein